MVDFTGHTPGPWEIEYGQLHPASETRGYTIRTNAFDVVSGHLAIRREEDALLIASAPDILVERNRLNERIYQSIDLLRELGENVGEWADQEVRDTVDGVIDGLESELLRTGGGV